jgi:hypothetical protein
MSIGQDKLELFADNAQIIRKEFVWQEDTIKLLVALLYAQDDKRVDCEAIRQCQTLIKQNTGTFSAFRGNMAICVATLLSLSPDPQELLSETLKVYDLLKGVKLRDSDFLVIAAYQIAAQADVSDYANVVARARNFYDEMKTRHFFHTGKDDYIFVAMLGLTNLDAANGVARIEQFYSRLKGEFRDKNSVHTLAQVLVLSNADASIANRILALRDALRAQKIKLYTTYTLPMLGLLALLPVEIDMIVRDLDAAQAALRTKKGFGSLSIDTEELLLFAAAITASNYIENAKDGMLTATLSTSINNIIIAQYTALIIVFSGSAAATVASTPS